MSDRVAEAIYRWRNPLCVLIVLGALAFIPTARVVSKVDNDITAWFSRQDPVYQQYERFREEFGGTRSLIVALKTDGGTIFADTTFRYLEDITARIERIQTVERVQSLANANIVSGVRLQADPSDVQADDALLVRPLSDVFHEHGVGEVRRLALRDELIRGDLISDDERVAAIVVTFDEDRVDEVRDQVIDAIHAAVLAKVPRGLTPPILILTLGAIYLMFQSWRRTLLAMAGVLISVVTIAGTSRLYVDTNHINFFSARHPLSTSARVIDEELSGIYSFNILLEGPEDSLKSPDALRRMDRVSAELRKLPYVKKVTSVADDVKRIHRELSGGGVEGGTLPQDGPAIAPELFVFGMSDRGRSELDRVVASDYSRAQIAVKLASMSSDLVFEQIGAAETIVAREFADSLIRPTVTGSGRLFSTLDHYLVTSQVSS